MKGVITKKRIMVVGVILLAIGIAGLAFSVHDARSRAADLDEEFADYQQKHTTLDNFLQGSASLSDLTKTFNDDQWTTLLNAEGKGFVAQQWVVAISIIVTLFGALMLVGLLLSWLIKAVSTRFKSAGSGSVFTHCHRGRSGVVEMLKRLFARKKSNELCWTSSDLKKRDKQTDMLFADKPVSEQNEQPAPVVEADDCIETQVEVACSEPEQVVESESEGLERPMAVMRELGEPVSQPEEVKIADAADEVINEPVEEPISVLRDLSDQVSAIREYATLQQGRMEKLEDGYDWTIIKTFCLRIIRCIDNLDMRIDKLSEQGQDTADLNDIRDELLFALESSGVEQFEPQLNSEYRGQEKKLEAVKDKVSCDDDGLKGKIAQVKKRGYYYMIEDDNVKVVRPSQVMLYA